MSIKRTFFTEGPFWIVRISRIPQCIQIFVDNARTLEEAEEIKNKNIKNGDESVITKEIEGSDHRADR